MPSLSYPIAGIAGIAGYLTCNPRRGAPRAIASFASSALRASDSRYSSSLSPPFCILTCYFGNRSSTESSQK